MRYTVKQLANLAGVSPRTLHFYDRIGLLKPEAYVENGYRCYGAAALLRLQQILFFKELDFSLAEIKATIDRPGFDILRALLAHRMTLQERSGRVGVNRAMNWPGVDSPSGFRERTLVLSAELGLDLQASHVDAGSRGASRTDVAHHSVRLAGNRRFIDPTKLHGVVAGGDGFERPGDGCGGKRPERRQGNRGRTEQSGPIHGGCGEIDPGASPVVELRAK
jgi:DNA-binding transcriptional MerR regulator